MHSLPKIILHEKSISQIPPTGQRRTILFKQLRQIQVHSELGGNFQWREAHSLPLIQISVAAGFAVSWVIRNTDILVLDIRGQ